MAKEFDLLRAAFAAAILWRAYFAAVTPNDSTRKRCLEGIVTIGGSNLSTKYIPQSLSTNDLKNLIPLMVSMDEIKQCNTNGIRF